ncbi:hypothetical protein DAI22_08g069507 [Oryza sativa Japonica Group]|nr:hypothetical protein DAI22_08g069728 [Oryza sativa Japonica Group]KAF2918602.1 hypothetical protein DAI22_08g069507 [Oryza sativa Japonica Group]
MQDEAIACCFSLPRCSHYTMTKYSWKFLAGQQGARRHEKNPSHVHHTRAAPAIPHPPTPPHAASHTPRFPHPAPPSSSCAAVLLLLTPPPPEPDLDEPDPDASPPPTSPTPMPTLLRRARPRCLLQIRADSTRRRPPLLLHRLLLRPAGFRCRLLPLPQCLPIAAVESTLFPTSSAASSTSRFSLVVHYRFCCNQPTLLSIYPAGHLKKNFVPRKHH